MKITDLKIGDVISGDDIPFQLFAVGGEAREIRPIEAVIDGDDYVIFSQIGRGKWRVIQTGIVRLPNMVAKHVSRDDDKRIQ